MDVVTTIMILYLVTGLRIGLRSLPYLRQTEALGRFTKASPVATRYDRAYASFAAALQPAGIVSTVRKPLLVVCGFIIVVATWPSKYLSGPAFLPPEIRLARAILYPRDLTLAVALLINSVTILVFAVVVGQGTSIMASCYFMIAALIANWVAWTITSYTLIDRLRISLSVPYRTFAAIVVVSFISLIIISTIMVRWPERGLPKIDSFYEEARRVLSFSKVGDLLLARTGSAAEIATAITAFAFYCALASQLLRFKQFRKTPSDISDQLNALIPLGDSKKAESVAHEARRNPAFSARVLSAEVQISLLREDYDTALNRTKRYFEVMKDSEEFPYATSTRDDLLTWMSNASFDVPWAASQCRNFVIFCSESQPSDGCLTIIATQQLVHRNEGEALKDLPNFGASYPLTAAYLKMKRHMAAADVSVDDLRSEVNSFRGIQLPEGTDDIVRNVWSIPLAYDTPADSIAAFVHYIKTIPENVPSWLLLCIVIPTLISIRKMAELSDDLSHIDEIRAEQERLSKHIRIASKLTRGLEAVNIEDLLS